VLLFATWLVEFEISRNVNSLSASSVAGSTAKTWRIEQGTGKSDWYILRGEGPTRPGGGEFEKEAKGFLHYPSPLSPLGRICCLCFLICFFPSLICHSWMTLEVYPCRMHQILFRSCSTRSGCWRKDEISSQRTMLESTSYQSLPLVILCRL